MATVATGSSDWQDQKNRDGRRTTLPPRPPAPTGIDRRTHYPGASNDEEGQVIEGASRKYEFIGTANANATTTQQRHESEHLPPSGPMSETRLYNGHGDRRSSSSSINYNSNHHHHHHENRHGKSEPFYVSPLSSRSSSSPASPSRPCGNERSHTSHTSSSPTKPNRSTITNSGGGSSSNGSGRNSDSYSSLGYSRQHTTATMCNPVAPGPGRGSSSSSMRDGNRRPPRPPPPPSPRDVPQDNTRSSTGGTISNGRRLDHDDELRRKHDYSDDNYECRQSYPSAKNGSSSSNRNYHDAHDKFDDGNNNYSQEGWRRESSSSSSGGTYKGYEQGRSGYSSHDGGLDCRRWNDRSSYLEERGGNRYYRSSYGSSDGGTGGGEGRPTTGRHEQQERRGSHWGDSSRDRYHESPPRQWQEQQRNGRQSFVASHQGDRRVSQSYGGPFDRRLNRADREREGYRRRNDDCRQFSDRTAEETSSFHAVREQDSSLGGSQYGNGTSLSSSTDRRGLDDRRPNYYQDRDRYQDMQNDGHTLTNAPLDRSTCDPRGDGYRLGSQSSDEKPQRFGQANTVRDGSCLPDGASRQQIRVESSFASRPVGPSVPTTQCATNTDAYSKTSSSGNLSYRHDTRGEKRKADESPSLHLPTAKRVRDDGIFSCAASGSSPAGSPSKIQNTVVPRTDKLFTNATSTRDSRNGSPAKPPLIAKSATAHPTTGSSINTAKSGLSIQKTVAPVVIKKTTPKPAEKNKMGIPLRWLKPVVKPKKPPLKVVAPGIEKQKAQPLAIPKKGALSSDVVRNPSFMVTDSSEGGSTISNARDCIAPVTVKPKVATEPVPKAIVTKKGREQHTKKDEELSYMDSVSACNSPEASRERGPNEWDSDAASDPESDSSEEEEDESDMVPYRKPNASGPSSPTRLKIRLSAFNLVTLSESPKSHQPKGPLKIKIRCSNALKASELSEELDPETAAKLERRQRKKNKEMRLLSKIQSEKTEFDVEKARNEMEEERRKREEAKPLTAAQIRAILREDDTGDANNCNWVRRSARQPSKALVNNKHVRALIDKLKTNDPCMVVLKLKKYIGDPNAPSPVLDAVLGAMEENTNCEALYIQNFNQGMRDQQVLHLLRILQQPSCKIWCLNIGENYNVKDETWEKFTKGLCHTNVTHMYASEHTITTDMKDEIRTTIRENRKKHNMHIDPNNLDVIVQCTHCWWNPINAKVLRPYLQKRGLENILEDKEAQGLRGSTSAAPVN